MAHLPCIIMYCSIPVLTYLLGTVPCTLTMGYISSQRIGQELLRASLSLFQPKNSLKKKHPTADEKPALPATKSENDLETFQQEKFLYWWVPQRILFT